MAKTLQQTLADYQDSIAQKYARYNALSAPQAGSNLPTPIDPASGLFDDNTETSVDGVVNFNTPGAKNQYLRNNGFAVFDRNDVANFANPRFSNMAGASIRDQLVDQYGPQAANWVQTPDGLGGLIFDTGTGRNIDTLYGDALTSGAGGHDLAKGTVGGNGSMIGDSPLGKLAIAAILGAPFALGGLGVGMAGAGGAGAGAADALGLAQMGQAAGLSGGALDSFVASGGTLGSTAAGGGGIGLGALSNAGGAVDPSWGVNPQTANTGTANPFTSPDIPEVYQSVPSSGGNFLQDLPSWMQPSPSSLASNAASSLLDNNGVNIPTTPNANPLTQNLGGGAGTTDFLGNQTAGNVYNLGNSGTGTIPGGTSNLGNLGGAKSALDRIMSGTATASDYAKLAGAGIDVAGALASKNRQDQLWDAGSDSRARFNAGMTPGFDLNSMPGYKSALDTSAQSYLSGLSAKGGNPAGVGSSQAETQKYLMGSLGLPAWNNYESLNSGVGFGGATVNAGTQGIQNLASAAGQGIGSLTNTNSDLTSTLGNLGNITGLLKKLGVGGDIFSTVT